MDSQNQDMYFTNLLSHDPQLAPTFGEQNGTSPLTFDDSPSLTPNNLIGQKKSIRGVNFSHEEDKLLVSAWLNCSLDAVQGTDQKQNQFWEKVFVYFQQYKQTTIERTTKSLSLRWSCIQRATDKFCSTLSQVEGLNQSGMTEQDKLEKTKIMYNELEKGYFQFEHCWLLLKDQPKWILHGKTNVKKQRRAMLSSTTPTPTRCSISIDDSVFNLESGNVTENEVTELDRPIGRKAEKRKHRAQVMQAEENIQLRKMKYTFLEESRTLEKEFYRLKSEKMKHDKELANEKMRLEAEKIELTKKESDQRIMMMDLSVMPEMQRQYFGELQREIMRRCNQA